METNVAQKGKLWGWIKRNVHIISAVATVVGLPMVAIALEAAVFADGGSQSGNEGSENNSFFKTAEEYEPTASEAAILDPWVSQKLTPFYKNLLIQAKQAFDNKDYDQQLGIINDVVMKMCVVRHYYKNYEKSGLSQSAILLRSGLIDTLFVQLDAMIENSIKNTTNLTVESYPVYVGDYNQFFPLNIKNITVNCEKYTVKVNESPIVKEEPLLTAAPVVVNPVTNEIIPDTINTVKKQSAPVAGMLVFFGTLGALLIFSSDEKEGNKKKQKDTSESA